MSLRPLRSAVQTWSPGRGIAADPLHRIVAAWPTIVGPDVAANSEPLDLQGTTLVIGTRSSAWSQQLQLLSPNVLRAIADCAPEGTAVARLTFRLGGMRRPERRRRPRLVAGPTPGIPARGAGARPAPEAPAADAAEALARFRARVGGRAPTAGESCSQCGARREGEPSPSGRCAPCDGEADRERQLALQRLVYMAPWLTLADLREHVPELSGSEFEHARRVLLQRWWAMLERARRAGKVSPSGIERHVASSYVLLHSRLPPDRITPAVVANLLGADMAELLWPGRAAAVAAKPRPGRSGPFVE